MCSSIRYTQNSQCPNNNEMVGIMETNSLRDRQNSAIVNIRFQRKMGKRPKLSIHWTTSPLSLSGWISKSHENRKIWLFAKTILVSDGKRTESNDMPLWWYKLYSLSPSSSLPTIAHGIGQSVLQSIYLSMNWMKVRHGKYPDCFIDWRQKQQLTSKKTTKLCA